MFYCVVVIGHQLADADASGGIDLDEFRQLYALLSVVAGEAIDTGSYIDVLVLLVCQNFR